MPPLVPPRYTSAPLPSYRYIPGQTPHPRRDPRGHSYGQPELPPTALEPPAWQGSARYLRAIDLFNGEYWWECHEVFEALWLGAGRSGALAEFCQGIVQVAAAHLKHITGPPSAAPRLLERGLARIAGAPSPYLGIDVRGFERDVGAYFRGERESAARITLDFG